MLDTLEFGHRERRDRAPSSWSATSPTRRSSRRPVRRARRHARSSTSPPTRTSASRWSTRRSYWLQQRRRHGDAGRGAARRRRRPTSCSRRRARSTARRQSSRSTEDAPIQPESVYAETKAMIERILRWYGVTTGLRSVSLRYFNAAGASADSRIGEDWATVAQPHPARDEGDARAAPAGAGVRRRLPDARRHVHPRLHPRRRPRRRPRQGARLPRRRRRDRPRSTSAPASAAA